MSARIYCLAASLLLLTGCAAGGAAVQTAAGREGTSQATTRNQLEQLVLSDDAGSSAEPDEVPDRETDGVEALSVTVLVPVEMAGAEVTLRGGEEVYVCLELTEGVYSAGSGLGDNWAGEFRLSTYSRSSRSADSLLFSLPLEVQGGYERQFDLLIDDYNEDGNPDFALKVGSGGAWSLSTYRVFTLLEDHSIEEILFEDGADEAGLVMMARRLPSIRLLQEEGHIVTYSMFDDSENGTTPLWRDRYGYWDGQFIRLDGQELYPDWDVEQKRELFREKLDAQSR